MGRSTCFKPPLKLWGCGLVDKDVLAKPYIVLTVMALFFLLAVNLPRIFHPVPGGEITPVVFPDVCVSVNHKGHSLVLNITNITNRTVLIKYVRIRENKIYVDRTLLPGESMIIYVSLNKTCNPGIGYISVVINGRRYHVLFSYACGFDTGYIVSSPFSSSNSISSSFSSPSVPAPLTSCASSRIISSSIILPSL